MITLDSSFGKASRELECFISEHQNDITSVLENQIRAAHFPARLQARYLPFATWEIVLSPDPASNLDSEPIDEQIVLDLFFNTGFGAGGNYKQLIIRRYGATDDCPQSREVQRQKYIVLHDDKNPLDALQKALNDLPLD